MASRAAPTRCGTEEGGLMTQMNVTFDAPLDSAPADPAQRPNMYSLRDVHRVYRRSGVQVRALDGVNLTVAQGEFLAIQGPTGQGKSTLLTLLGGLDRPTRGQVFFQGRDLCSLNERTLADLRAAVFGFVFQTFNLIPTFTAQQNVEAALVPLGVRPAERRERAQVALSEVGLGDRLAHAPAELSGGQQQRAAIARALVKEPKVLLADEPTGNLDEETRDEIVGVLEALWQRHGLTLVVVTHDSTVARRAERTAVIRGGRVG